MSAVVRIGSIAGLVLLAGGLSNVASASNGLHPRTGVEWNDTVCMETVDKSATGTFTFGYDIPFEDTEVTEDEVEDSRRHQFLGLCRQVHSQIFLPRWIADADVEAAVQSNLVEVGTVEPEDVFETSTFWAGCWHRITADDERRPITDAMAAQPVVWDVSSVPEGTYTIWGYTWEPAFNIWVQRSGGVVKIHDGGTPESIGPGAAITTTEQTPYLGDTIDIEGCVNTAAGSTMVGYYASTDGAQDPDWQPTWVAFTAEEPVEGASFSLPFAPPEELGGESVMVRVEVTDGDGRSFDAHMQEAVIVLNGMNPDDCSEGGGFIGNPGCPDTDTGSGGNSDSDSTSNGGGSDDTGVNMSMSGGSGTSDDNDDTSDSSAEATSAGGNDPPKSCGCQTPAWRGGFGGWAFLLVVVGFARRRPPLGRP